MKKIYYLKTCDTCKRILKLIPLDGFTLQEIKTEAITSSQLKEMKVLSGSYEALFSRRSRKYSSLNLKDKNLTETDFKKLILQEYTFLQRPVIIIDNVIFIGNSKKNMAALISFFE